MVAMDTMVAIVAVDTMVAMDTIVAVADMYNIMIKQ